MKVTSVKEQNVLLVTTNEDGENQYIRDSDGLWWSIYESSVSFTNMLESEFQKYTNQPNPLKDFVDFCVDNGVDNGICEMMDKFLKK